MQSVHNNTDDFIEYFENTESRIPKEYNSETVIQVARFIKWLGDGSFLFLLLFFFKRNAAWYFIQNTAKIETDVIKV